jgi:hypothetical protein
MTTTIPAPASRSAEIRTIARTAGLDSTWADGLIDRQATVEEARAEAFAAMRERTEPASRIQTVTRVRELDDPQERVRAMGEAIFARSYPAHRPSDRARQYAGLSLVEMARESLRSNGISTTGLSAASVVARATGMVGLHSTSDFALALGDSVGRVLVASYRAAPSPLLQIVRRVEVPDFRTRQTVRMTAALGLERVNEAGEFRGGSISEAGESYSVRTFGKIIGLTRQAIVNDDLNALGTIPAMMGTAAANFVSQFAATLLASNPVMADGEQVFSAAHGNVGTPAADLDVDTLSEARLLMRSQRDDAGEIVGVRPAFLIVSPPRETQAEAILASIAATTVADVNPFAGGLQLIVEPRLAGDRWYLAAEPAVMPSIELASLAGEAEPQVITENGFDIDGVRWRVRLDLGGGVIDYRGLVTNAGAVG